jgi:putative membrane protein
MRLFSKDNADRIATAISDAESQTAGEIVAVVAPESSSYLYVPFMWAALFALLVPWPLIFFTWMTLQKIYLIQLITFFLLLCLFWPRRMRMALTPKAIRDGRAHRRAVEQFLVQNLHTTRGRTGVLIFVSVAEHYAEILADTGIDAKVPKGTWQKIVDEMTAMIGEGRATDGFVHAVSEVGKHLAKHIPPGTHDPNELPDHLIILTD